MLNRLFISVFRWVFLNPLVRLLEPLLKRKDTVAVAGRNARRFADNPRYFFQYCVAHPKVVNAGVRVYFFTKNKGLYRGLKQEYGKRIVYTYTFRAMWIYCRCSIACMGHGPGDFFPFMASNRHKVVLNFFHAIPLKNVGISVWGANVKRLKKQAGNYDYFVVSSGHEAIAVQRELLLNKNQTVVTGQPRNDRLTGLPGDSRAKRFSTENQDFVNILYAPTFRDDGSPVRLFPFEDRHMEQLNERLKQWKARVHIRCHINELEKLGAGKNEFSNLKFMAPGHYPDVQEILPAIHLLITDYSSVCLDFLLLDRPMIFIPYDIQQYRKVRGFMFDYQKSTAGPKVSSQEALLAEVDKSLADASCYASHRKRAREYFHQYTDGKNSKRIFDLLLAQRQPE